MKKPQTSRILMGRTVSAFRWNHPVMFRSAKGTPQSQVSSTRPSVPMAGGMVQSHHTADRTFDPTSGSGMANALPGGARTLLIETQTIT